MSESISTVENASVHKAHLKRFIRVTFLTAFPFFSFSLKTIFFFRDFLLFIKELFNLWKTFSYKKKEKDSVFFQHLIYEKMARDSRRWLGYTLRNIGNVAKKLFLRFQLEHFRYGVTGSKEFLLGDFSVCVEVTLTEQTLHLRKIFKIYFCPH